MPREQESGLWILHVWPLSTLLLWAHWLMRKAMAKFFKKAVKPGASASRTPAGGSTDGLVALRDRIEATLYGNCIGDAIGLLTEFMSKEEARAVYGEHEGRLEFEHKRDDFHRSRWIVGDWTDDSDQMLLIMRSLVKYEGKPNQIDFGEKLKTWAFKGFKELGDQGGCGIGATTYGVLSHPSYKKNPEKAAREIWEQSRRQAAPNGAVMRTSAVAAYCFHDLDIVAKNALAFCKVTHADPRCQASVVAVVTAIALMLQGEHQLDNGQFDVQALTEASLARALVYLDKDEDYERNKQEIESHIRAEKIEELNLAESAKIGYTLKCMGAGFWALRQDDFRQALETITYEAGDADTNGAVAGAMLGCKLGKKGLPESWLGKLANRKWLDQEIEQYIQLIFAKLPDKYYERSTTPGPQTEPSCAENVPENTIQENECASKKLKAEDQNQSAGDQRESAGDQRDSAGDQRESAGDQNESAGDQRESAGDQRESAGDQNESAGDQRESAGDQRESAEDQNQSAGDQSKRADGPPAKEAENMGGGKIETSQL